ncbi:MAG TPA: hypothetical protein DCY03_06260 [Planctomycetaceae bacterium]|nr:hypothetical protein [Planctomycetaceae bacterium]|tara:strand:- start:90 stop:692 length:603 start_codon:yes stop_codon:yes gene_type:complete
MIIVKNRDWNRDYREIVIDSIYDSFPPATHFSDCDGDQLVQSRGDDYDEIIRDFSGKRWDQLDHSLISFHHEAPVFMSYWGFLKFLPAFLVDLFDGDTQVVHSVWNRLLDLEYESTATPQNNELSNAQRVCCILAFVRVTDFPLDTTMPARTPDEYYHNPTPEAAFNVLTLGLHHERITAIREQIEMINDSFVGERWDSG